jgi:hypothetical protein
VPWLSDFDFKKRLTAKFSWSNFITKYARDSAGRQEIKKMRKILQVEIMTTFWSWIELATNGFEKFFKRQTQERVQN